MSGTNPPIPGYYTGRPVNSSEQATTAAVEQNDGNQQPQVYYVGRPVNAGAEKPPAAPEQEDMAPPDPPGYYKGRPVKSVRPVESEKQPADGPSRAEPSFFAKWLNKYQIRTNIVSSVHSCFSLLNWLMRLMVLLSQLQLCLLLQLWERLVDSRPEIPRRQ